MTIPTRSTPRWADPQGLDSRGRRAGRSPAAGAPRIDTPTSWRHEPMMWLVIGGPALVVVAAVATAVIATRGADPVLPTERVAAARADAPAMQARNHAATATLAVPLTAGTSAGPAKAVLAAERTTADETAAAAR